MSRLCAIVSLLLIIFNPALIDSQTANNQNRKNLELLAERHQKKSLQKKQEAIKWAQEKGAPVRTEFKDGTIIEIQEILNGYPLYYITENINAAKTVSTDDVWPGGSAGLNLTGLGITIGEWDGGGVRTSHQEFNGRVTQMDSPSGTSSHSTHVAGTMIARGMDSDAKGMAYQATLDAYEWSSDESEMATAAANGLLFSNHSYGFITGWEYNYFGDGRYAWFGDISVSQVEDHKFGFYLDHAADWDEIAYNAPYYLIVKSAGNDRNDTGPSPGGTHWYYNGSTWALNNTTRDRDGGNDGYDCIPGGSAISKNVLTVGAVDDIPGGYTMPSDVVMSSFSGWGPADDGRIKPDIVANGISLYSCDDDYDSDYTSKSGTSMAAPNTTGSLALLQEHYKETHNDSLMLAATLKALVIHTADEAGAYAGPDYEFGWGLLNTTTAAELITQDTTDGNFIREVELQNNGQYSLQVNSNGVDQIKVTIAWTDPAGTPPSAQLNPRTPMLANDLDLRITNDNQTHYPWKLDPDDPSHSAIRADNTVDNVEQIIIEEPIQGGYTIVVNHKEQLTNSRQQFSMILEGVTFGSDSCIAPYIACPNVEGKPGQNLIIDIAIEDNPLPIDAFGFEFNYCSDKLSLVSVEKYDLTDSFQFFQFQENTPGTVTIGGFNTDPILANQSGAIARITLQVDQCTEGETCDLEISNLTDDVAGLNICDGSFTCVTCLLGDVTDDGALTPADALCVFQRYLEPSYQSTDCPCLDDASDANCDQLITPGDALIIFTAYLNNIDPPLFCPVLKTEYDQKENFGNEKLYLKPTGNNPEQEMTFSLMIDNPAELRAFGIDLGFPDDLLRFVDVKPTSVTECWQILEGTEPLAGVVRIGGFNQEAIQQKGSLSLATITFREKRGAQGEGELWLFNASDDLSEIKKENLQFSLQTTDVRQITFETTPKTYGLGQNYPNPFNMETDIFYQLPEASEVKLTIYNSRGQKIQTLVAEQQNAGHYVAHWDGRDESGQEVSSGVYVYKLIANDFTDSKKLILMK